MILKLKSAEQGSIHVKQNASISTKEKHSKEHTLSKKSMVLKFKLPNVLNY
jgi:hypothetical protein